MPSILGANSVSGYTISNSLRFNAADSPSLQKTFGSAGNQKTMTFSFWVKRSIVAEDFAGGGLVSCGTADGDEWNWTFRSNVFDLRWETTNGNQGDIRTTAKFRDLSAWYHMVLRLDTTDGTAANRIRWYVNGTLQTDHDEAAYPSQNLDFKINGTVAQEIGRFIRSDKSLVGYLADFYFVDGTSYGPDTFAETNDEGVWIPKDAKSDVTFGTNGYFLEFQQTGTSGNSSGMGADTSGNDNHWAASNLEAHDVTTDTPSNNFCTLNPLTNDEQTFSEGATKTVKGGNAGTFATSTFEVNKGKWYFESKLLNYSGDSRPTVGIAQSHNSYRGTLAGAPNNVAYYLLETSYYRSNTGSAVTVNSSPATNDIYMWGVDLDNLKFYIGKNGSWLHSSDPSAGSNGLAIEVADYYSVATSPNDNGTDNTRNNEWLFNFGNPAYTNSSSVSDASGFGDFEYAVPTGFYSYCTKNLANFG